MAIRSVVAMVVFDLAVLLIPTLSLPLLAAADANTIVLSPVFHADSCPQLEDMVRSSVQAALRSEIALAAGLLRVFFHDCFPQGCDASVLLRGTNTEQALGPNRTLQPRAMQLIEDIRAEVHAACGATVSCADITALATRDAVVVSGGPSYDVPQGQLDSLSPASKDDVLSLPSPAISSIKDLKSLFRSRGLRNAADVVALSGAHTVGRAGCIFFKDRSDRQDDAFSRRLAANCSREPDRLQNLDVITPDLFDNSYYQALLSGQGVFTSDMALVDDRGTAATVRKFAESKDSFFAQFAKSMAKLSNAPRPAGNVGEIRRRSCFNRNDDAGDEAGFAASA